MRYDPPVTLQRLAPEVVAMLGGGGDTGGTSSAFGIGLGDSICGGAQFTGHMGMTVAMSEGRLVYRTGTSAGVDGQTSAMIMARLETDCLAKKPGLVILNAGSNDAAASVTLATYRANMTTMMAAIRAAGIPLIVVSPPPRNGMAPLITQYTAWLGMYCQSQNIPYVDTYRLFADPVTGEWMTGWSTDGVHPNGKGYQRLCEAIASVLKGVIPPSPIKLTSTKVDALNLLINGVFSGDANADGLADGWTLAGSGTATTTITAGDMAANDSGDWQRLDVSVGQKYITQTTSVAGKVNAGDRLLFGVRYRSGGQVAANNAPILQYNLVGGAGHVGAGTVYNRIADVTAPLLITREVIVGSTPPTHVGIALTYNAPGGWSEVAQATVYNLTTLGLV